MVHTLPARHALALELRDEAAKESRLSRIVEIEDRIYDRASGVVEAALSFHEVSADQAEPPPDWIERYGLDGAKQRLEVAKSGWMPHSVAPAGVKLAAQVMAGIARGRGHRVKLTQNNVNVKISLPPPTSSAHPSTVSAYPEKDIE